MKFSRILKGQVYQGWVKFKMGRTFHVRSALYKAWSYIILSIWLPYKEEANIVHRPNSGLRDETPYDILYFRWRDAVGLLNKKNYTAQSQRWWLNLHIFWKCWFISIWIQKQWATTLNTQNFERRYVCSFIISNHEDVHARTCLNSISSLWYANQDTSQIILRMHWSIFMQTNNCRVTFSPATWEQAAAVNHRSASWLHLWIKFLEPLVYCYLATSPATWEQAAAVDHHSASWLHLWIEFLISLVYWTQFHSKCITWSMNTNLFKAYEPNWLLLQPFN